MAATEKQIESLKKAREARAAKNQTTGTGVVPVKNDTYHGRVWVDALLTAMKNKQVSHASHVADCMPIADEVLRLYKEKF